MFVVEQGGFQDQALGVKLDDKVVNCPGTVPATIRGVIGGDRPGNAPGRLAPPSNEEAIIRNAGIQPIQFLENLLAGGRAGDNEFEIDLFADAAGGADGFGGGAHGNDEATGTSDGKQEKQQKEETAVKRSHERSFRAMFPRKGTKARDPRPTAG